LDVLKALHVEPTAARFDLPEYPASAKKVDDYLHQSSLDGQFALINMGASWPSRLWPADRFGAVARRLGTRFSVPSVVVWAGESERRRANRCAAASQGHAIVAPQTSLTELASLARRATLFLSADTGPLHLAAAVGLPCVGLYGPTRPECSGPHGPQHVSLQEYYQDGTCRERRKAENTAMRAISVDDAFNACKRVLIAQLVSGAIDANVSGRQRSLTGRKAA
jgi:ADP-heptose:LPS heptosyltransferase